MGDKLRRVVPGAAPTWEPGLVVAQAYRDGAKVVEAEEDMIKPPSRSSIPTYNRRGVRAGGGRQRPGANVYGL